MQRKQLVYLLAILALLVSMLPLSAAAQEAPPAPLRIEEFAAPDNKALDGSGAAGSSLPLAAPDGMAFFNETEPNDTAATANALPGSQVAVYGNIPAADYDYFSFTANAGDRVYAAVQTQWSTVSGDSRLDIMASDGTTSLEFDDDSGSFSGLSSAIGGTIIPTAGTYYVRVYGYTAATVITPYFLHVRVQSGTPTAESEPNNTTVDADPLAASGWMSGTITATTDPDLFWFTLNAGDSVYLGLDMDPGRIPSNTNWNGRLGLGLFNNFFLVANDASTTKPHAEAFFMTAKQAGTYYAYVDSASAAGLGANARYHLSVSIYPKQVQNNCTTFTSADVPKVIGPGVGTATSTIVVPGTVTSSITDINATIVLTHSIMADLDVTLVGPTAASAPLFTDVGSAATGGQTQMNVGLDDQAALPIGPFIVVSGMVNQPEQPGRLSTFNGTPAVGTWTLQLADDTVNTSGGRLLSWSLEICGNPPPAYAIELNKTVGTEPAVCATSDSITIPPGGVDVYYCYTVRNTGLNALNVHDLVDSELGTIFTGVNYALAPGATYSYIQQATIYNTVTNTGTWTAYNLPDGGPTASDSDTATVNVRPMACPVGYQPVTVDASFFDNPFPPAGWSVTNTSTGCVAPGVPQWTNTNPGNRANLTGGAGPFAIADSDKCGAGSSLNTIMSTGMLDFTGMISPTVSFNTDYDDIGTGDDRAILASSTDGGATWAPLFVWDSDHRGPLLVTQALPGAGENDVMVRWDYASTWDWWWEVDNAFLTACEPIPSNPAITLDKTVGTDDSVCATTDEITLPYGGGLVTYCYEVTNTGDVTLNRHDLVDSELGTLLNNFPYSLAPGASAFITGTTHIGFTTVNTATWTAYNPTDGFTSAWATDAATVTVDLPAPAIVLTKTVGTNPLACATSDEITVPANTDVTYCYTVENTGNVGFNMHDLSDSELGILLNDFNYGLAPGASLFVTETATIAVTTVNTATWRAEHDPLEGNLFAQATDVATVTVQAANVPAIELNKTVGTVPAVCAATNQISVPYGTTVYYCYQVQNTGSVTMTVHSLVDDHLGTLATNLSYVLPPGAFSPQVIVPDTAVVAVTNTATWTAASSVGYTVDTNAAFNYIPINATGTALGLGDDGEANITIPWGATFFGITSSNLRVGNNGGILFGVTTGDLGLTNVALPTTAGLPAPAILPFWDDLDSDTGNVYWEVQGTAPNRMLIVEWYDRPHYSNTPGHTTFQAILYETTNEIKYQYLDVDFGDPAYNNGASATVGINKDATTALQVSFNQPVIQNGQAILFSPVAILTASDSDWAEVNVLIPNIDVDPLSMSATQATNTTTNQTLNIGNTGGAPLTWEIAETEPDRPASAGVQAAPEPVFNVPAVVSSKADCAAFENYPGREPQGWAQFCGQPAEAPASSPQGPTSNGYSVDLRNDRFVRFALNNFPGQVLVGPQTGNLYGLDFDSTATTLYALNDAATDQLGTVNTATGVFTPIVNCPAPAAGVWTGLSIDPTTNVFYASTAANLYTIDPVTCSPVLIGPFGVSGGIMIDISIGSAGVMYGHDIFTDSIYTINTSTGAATLVGLTGFAANFAQGMDFDNEDGTLYIWLYIGTGANRYGTVNLATGAVTPLATDNPLGEFEGATETLGTCVPNDYGWLSTSPITGTTTANSVTPVTVTFDSTGLAVGVYTGQLCIRSNDPDAGPGNGTELVQVPVTLTVQLPTAVTLSGLAAAGETAPTQAPLPLAGLPLAALPAAIGLALGAAYALRRRE